MQQFATNIAPHFNTRLLRVMISISPLQDAFEEVGVPVATTFEFVQCAYHYLALVQSSETIPEQLAMQWWDDNHREDHLKSLRRITRAVEEKGGKGLAVYRMYCFTFESLYERQQMQISMSKGKMSVSEVDGRNRLLMVERDKLIEEIRQLKLNSHSGR